MLFSLSPKACFFSASLMLLAANARAQNELNYHETDFQAATTGVGQLSGYDGWIATDTLGTGIIEEGIIGQGKAAYVGFLINEGKTTAAAVRPFTSQYPQSGRPVYSVDLDFVIMDSTNGERDLFFINITGENGQLQASILFDNLSKSILSRSAATGTYAATGFSFINDVPGQLEFRLDLAADTWSAKIGSTTIIEAATLIGSSGVDPAPLRLNVLWGLRDTNAPGDNYIIFDNIHISSDSGPYAFIQNHPASQGVLPEATALLSVTATGETPLQYQWYAGRSGATEQPIAGATSASYETPPILEPAEYWVRISNGFGYIDSDTALITPRRNPPITVETVEVGSPGNLPDNYGPGAVNYTYHIGKYPVTNEEYVTFLNAVAAQDPHGLYDPRMGTEMHGGIERSGLDGSFTYAVRTADAGYNSGQSMARMPANYVSFWSAARFANWLTSGNTETGVYDFGGVTHPSPSAGARDQTLFLNGGVAIANENEWYKAAFFDPSLNANPEFSSWGYRDYSNSSNVSPAGLPLSSQKALNYNSVVGTVTRVGAYGANSASAFGTFEQSGNVFEWIDDVFASNRRGRGGAYDIGSAAKHISGEGLPDQSFANTSFRIASSEPVMRRAVLNIAQSGVGEGEIYFEGQPIENLPQALVFQEGSVVSLTALAAFGSTFQGWSGDVVDSQSTITFTMDADASINAVFEVMSGPPIIDQPQSRTVLTGEDVTLTVNAFGDGLSYQWYLGQSGDTTEPVSAATGTTLELQNLLETASYWVRITASDGEFTDSQTATLTVVEQVGLNHWSAMTSDTSNSLNGVAWGGGQFVVVGNSGTILTSVDGRTWQTRTSGTAVTLLSVAWSGSTFVAVGWNGTILTSGDGVSWLARTSGTTSALYGITYGSSGFVTVGASGTILTSSDGSIWTSQTSPRTGTIRSVTWTGQDYVAVGQTYFQSGQYGGTRNIFMSSSDGSSWTGYSAPLESYFTVIARDNDTTLLAGSGGRLWRSGSNRPNPEEWQTATNAVFYGSLWTGREYLMVGSGGTILSSTDGARWASHSHGGFPYTFQSVAKNDDVIVIVGSSGQIRLSVISPVPPPAIVNHPATQTVAGGVSVLLSVSATGTGLTYQWYEGNMGDTTNPVFDGTSAILNTLPVTSETRYWVRVTDAAGLFADSSAGRLIPPTGDRDFSWKWLNPLPSGVTFHDVIHTTEGFVAVGHNGRISIQPENEPWRVLDVFVPQTLNAITWNGSRYVAVGDKGTVLTSSDGLHWQVRFSDTTRTLRGVTWDGTRFAAVGHTGLTLSSTDGIEWSRHDTTETTNLLGIAGDGQQLVAVGSGGSVRTSTDGITWTARTSGTNQTLNDLIWDGTRFIACGNAGTILTSADGISWSASSSGTNRSLKRIRSDGTGYLAVGDYAIILESADALTWSVVAEDPTYIQYTGIALGDGKDVIVGNSGTLTTRSNGGSWTYERESGKALIRDIISGNGKMIAVDSSGIIRASQGIDEPWQQVHTATGSTNINAVAHAPSGFVAVGSSGWIAHSADGEIWQEVTSPTTSELRHVAWTGSSYLAVGSAGAILSSSDGLLWTAQNSGVSSYLYASASFGNTHVAIGSSGTVLKSADLTNWEPVSIPSSAASYHFSGIAHSGSGFLIFANQSNNLGGGYYFRTLRSQDGITWENGNSFLTPGIMHDLQWNGERYIAVGTSGEVWSSDNGFFWTQRPKADATLLGATWFDGHWVVVGSNETILAATDSETVSRPVILASPTSLRAELAETVEISVTANGSYRYQWFRGVTGDVSEPASGAFSSTLSIPVQTTPVSYWVRVSHGFGAWTDSHAATVSELPDIPTFVEWTAAAGLTGADAEPGATPYGDGVANLLKYAFNLDPATADRRTLEVGNSDTAGLPGIEITSESPSEMRITIEFLRRRDSALNYTPVASSDLDSWSPLVGPEAVEIIDEEWERVTVTEEVDPHDHPRRFGAIRVDEINE